MTTDSTPQRLLFGRLGRREIQAEFTGGSLSSDGGALLLGLAEAKTGIITNFVERAMRDHREQAYVEHSLVDLIRQRVFAIALGYEDLNDHDTLRHDALLATALGKRDPLGSGRRASETGKPLASSATLNRIELASEDPASDRYKRVELVPDAAEEFFVDYVIGVARNKRLEKAVAKEIKKVKQLYEESGEASRVYKDLLKWRTLDSWSRERRVVAKAEYLGKANPRFVATSFSPEEVEAWQVYEVEYCPRGEAENRIKEQQLDLFGTRTSCSAMAGNQIRLYFAGLAYLLIQAIRALGLKGTDLCRAQAGTIRVKLLKIAAAVKVTARRVWVRLSSYCPFAEVFARARDNLFALPALVM